MSRRGEQSQATDAEEEHTHQRNTEETEQPPHARSAQPREPA
jgi:hypothetical protein